MTATDQKYIEFGKRMVIRRDPKWQDWLKKANRRKNGRPLLYADGMFVTLALIRTCTGMSYRAPGGMCQESLGYAPDHTTIRERIMLLEMDHDTLVPPDAAKPPDGGGVRRLMVDTSGMTPAERGECMRDKWDVKRDFYKLHIIADADDGYIRRAILTDSGKGSADVHRLVELLDMALEDPDIQQARGDAGAAGAEPAVELYADGAYGSRKDMATCAERGVKPIIRANITSTTGGRGHGAGWSDFIRDQLGTRSEDGKVRTNSLTREERRANQKAWMKRNGYGRRWRVEGVFSSIKRI